jgi:hypothetical protein
MGHQTRDMNIYDVLFPCTFLLLSAVPQLLFLFFFLTSLSTEGNTSQLGTSIPVTVQHKLIFPFHPGCFALAGSISTEDPHA